MQNGLLQEKFLYFKGQRNQSEGYALSFVENVCFTVDVVVEIKNGCTLITFRTFILFVL